MTSTHIFTKREEIANAITHGIGALFSVLGLIVLIGTALATGSLLHVVSASVFGSTMFILYFSSTMAHALPKGKAKDIFEICDHAAIYLFIAGSYTPFLLHVMEGALSWTLFWIVWGIALCGIVFKAFFTKKFIILSTLLYLVMGWLVVFGWHQIATNLHPSGITLLILGGLFYTVGTVFYVWRGFPYHHLVWHLFVIAGSVCHYFCVLFYVLPIA